MEQAGKDVPAHIVGAQQVLGAGGRPEAGGPVGEVGGLVQEEGEQQDQQDLHPQKDGRGRGPAVRPEGRQGGMALPHLPSPPHPTPGSARR